MKEKKKIDFKYELTRNNYVGLLFFALVLASTLYIIKKTMSILIMSIHYSENI